MAFNVISAAYGALAQGISTETQAKDVTGDLQHQFAINPDGIVTINNEAMGGDPSPGFTKHFGAIVVVNGKRLAFACQENQTINFGSTV
jgi:hypothetical protein